MQFVLIMKRTCILCEVRSRYLQCSSTDFKIGGGHSRRRPGFDLRPVLCKISGDQSGRFFLRNSTFPGHYHYLNAQTYLHLHATLTKRTSGQNLGTLKKRCVFSPETVGHWYRSNFTSLQAFQVRKFCRRPFIADASVRSRVGGG